jgi:hypothetical protein
MTINLRLVVAACGALFLLTQTGCPTATTPGGTAAIDPPTVQTPAQITEDKPAEGNAAEKPTEQPTGEDSPAEPAPSEPTSTDQEPAEQIAAAESVSEEPKKETPKPNSDANPSARPKADRTPRKPGEPIKITFDHIILGMQADIPFRPWMLKDEVKELEGQRVSITGVMLDTGTFKKGDNFILLRNKECKYGKGGQADHLAEVRLRKGHVFGYTKESVRVEGTFRIEPFTGSDGNTWSIYVIEDAIAREQ